MPKVYLPLGSKAASGKIGEMFVYQGTTVRALVKPVDPKTAAQLNVRRLFADMTKMLKAAGLWPRGAWKTIFGVRWFTTLTGMLKTDALGAWSTAEVNWAGFTENQKAAWRAVAPCQDTGNDPGRMFYDVAFSLFWFVDNAGYGYFGMGDYYGDDSATAAAWWAKGLDDVVMPGLYDNDGGVLSWNADPVEVQDVNAYGGSYLTNIPDSTMGGICVFKGVQVKITYKKGPVFGTACVTVVGDVVEYLNQNLLVDDWQNVWVSSYFEDGLHMFNFYNMMSALVNIDAIEIVGKKPRTSIPKVTGQLLEIGVIDLAEQTIDPVAPSAGFQKVYTKADGALYALGPSGTVKTAFVEAASSAEVTAGAQTAKYIAPKALKDAGIVAAGFQPIDADLSAIAALTPANDDILQRKSGAWANRTMLEFVQDVTWVQDTTTWTRTGNYTFTLAVDARAWLYKGVKVRFTDTTVKYGVVLSSVCPAGTTTVTLATNTGNLMVANPTARYFSYAAAPIGFPAWFDYTPAWSSQPPTQPVLNNGTLTGKFQVLSSAQYVYHIGWTAGTTTTFGGTIWRFTLPIAAAVINTMGTLVLFDASAGTYYPGIAIEDSVGKLIMVGAANTYFIGATVPITFGNGDGLTMTGIIFY
jgi:hypothetical protein